MPDLKRIAPDDVLDAYDRTGLKPERGVFFRGCSACAMSAYAAANLMTPSSIAPDACMIMRVMVKDGFSRNYLGGFMEGFDGDPFRKRWPWTPAERFAGYDDGKAAWAAVETRRRVVHV